MASTYLLSSSSLLPGDPESAFQCLADAPLEDLFTTRSGLIPRVRGCEGQQGPWGTVGQTRTVVLDDGSRNVETLVAVDPPSDYRYTLTDFTGPMKLLVRKVEGRFTYVPEGDGTRATWSWTLHPTSPLARLAFPLLGASWRTMAKNMWPRFAARMAA
ncbi:MAG TPA: SRPBCC family protein [Marmoricola sp.]|nr:SRPBCC family protein [Marmoricola sp.]